ncbi:MAG: Gfo/Idh/MocA family oxidoreductase [Kiritimatiellia bacterium]
MSRKYRVGIIGFAHPHINHVASMFAAHPQADIVACADTIPLCPELRSVPYTRDWNIRNVMKLADIPKRYNDYNEMLAEEKLDIVLINSENNQHPDIVEASARAGAHVCVEKPMAISLSDAQRMNDACQAAGTSIIVNWPATWLPHARKAKELIDSGAIGHLVEINYRVGHSGPYGPGASHKGVSESAEPLTEEERAAIWLHQEAAGGGAMIDLCCYGMMYGVWYTGEKAVAVQGIRANLDSKWCDADDNGVMIARFPDAIAVAQGSWTTLGRQFLTAGPLMIFGSEGALSLEIYGEKPVVQLTRGAGHEVEIFEPEPLPEGRDNLAAEFIHHLETGEPVHETLSADFNLAMTEVFDAGLRSAATGDLIKLD